ncbi:MAG: alginate lyase family protein [bacterium]
MVSLFFKIRKISVKEILFRTKKLIGQKLEIWGHTPYLKREYGMCPHIHLIEKDEIFNTYLPQTRYIQEADKICEHKFALLGINVEYKDKIEWHKHPLTKQEYPLKLYSNIYKFLRYGDVKYVWEINRHEHFVSLGLAWCLSGNEKYRREFCAQITDWIDSNPYLLGVNWSSGLEVAVRAINWVMAYNLFLTSMDAEVNYKILNSLYQHGRYIIRNLSFFSSPYNHLIGEATALFILGFLFPGLKEVNQWKKTGWQILKSELKNQFYEDGGNVEQAVSYHHYTLGFYLLAIILQMKNDIEVEPEILKAIERVMEFSMYLTKPDSRMPMIGDGDGARSIKFGVVDDHWDFRTFLSIGAILFNRGDFKKISGKISQEAIWLLGSAGLKRYEAICEKAAEQTSMAFSASGYFIMRSHWDKDGDYLCFDCGQQAAGLHKDATPSVAHGHADALSLELVVNGQPLIIDPAMYSYFDEHFQNYFRATPAHNTIVLDRKSQATLVGKLGWSNTYSTKCQKWFTSELADYVEGEHDGYAPIIHKRIIFFNKLTKYWLIFDYLDGKEKHLIEQYFHFAPIAMEVNKDSIVTQHALLMPINPDLVNLEVEEGWVAKNYGVKIKAPVVKYSTTSILPASLGVIIYPTGLNRPKIEQLNKLAFKLITPHWIDYHLLGGDCEGIETDARFSHIRFDNKGNIKGFTIIQGSFLMINQKEIFRTTQLTDMVKIL